MNLRTTMTASVLGGALLLAAPGINPTPAHGAPPANAAAPAGSGTLELLFTYGSEKQKWVESATERFNAAAVTLPSGERIRVTPVAVGSGELIDEALAGRRKPHLVSPAAGAFVALGNATARERGEGDLVGPTEELARSPIIVAMWRDMAEAIGWPRKAVRWRDVFEYARDPSQWKQVRKPQWGSFKFGHTHPDFSNSGLHALFLESYAALGKFEGATRRDFVAGAEQVGQFLHEVEHSIVHYGSSTGFLAHKMQSQGREYLSAAILYENLVIEMNQEARRQDSAVNLPQVVAIYPAEGTFPCEHPVGVVLRPWVTPKHREAAEAYIAFLRSKPQQEEAKRYGFRPADTSIPLDDLLKPELGVDATQPRRILAPPPSSAVSLLREVWRRNKRHADIVLAVDTSASMKGEKIRSAEAAAKEFVDLLGEGDSISTMLFGTDVEWLAKDVQIDAKGAEEAKKSIDGLIPDGDTALYQAIQDAYAFLESRSRDRTRAIVVLSDGNDTKRSPTLEALLKQVKNNGEDRTIFIFTIAYGSDADPKTLSQISAASQGKTYEGAVGNIRKVFTEIATFF